MVDLGNWTVKGDDDPAADQMMPTTFINGELDQDRRLTSQHQFRKDKFDVVVKGRQAKASRAHSNITTLKNHKQIAVEQGLAFDHERYHFSAQDITRTELREMKNKAKEGRYPVIMEVIWISQLLVDAQNWI